MNKLNIWPLILCFPFLVTGQSKDPDFDSMVAGLCSGSIPYVQPEELKSQIRNGSHPVILDTREKGEYGTSHIEEATWVGYETFAPKRVKELDKSDTIVVYCSVGYRSEKIGEQLKELGFQNVFNLYGGIFEWKNEGNEVVDQENRPTNKVHTYNQDWSIWLKKGEKVYE